MDTVRELKFAVGLAAILAGCSSALAFTNGAWKHRWPAPSSPMIDGAPVLAPLAHIKFCLRSPAECSPNGSGEVTEFSERALEDLDAVNRLVNRGIRPHKKVNAVLGGNWTINPAAGDCNDYAVSKRHELLRRGWSSNSLLLAEVETSWGEAHLVLVARTSEGDYVLDNLADDIRPWSETGYRWVKRQSASDPRSWVSLGGGSNGRFAQASGGV